MTLYMILISDKLFWRIDDGINSMVIVDSKNETFDFYYKQQWVGTI
jgi:hypothetical protein